MNNISLNDLSPRMIYAPYIPVIRIVKTNDFLGSFRIGQRVDCIVGKPSNYRFKKELEEILSLEL